MPTSTAGTADQLIGELNDLLQLDHDAVQAYTVAIDLVRDARYREQLVEFRADHKRHIEELAGLVRARGGLPVELPHATAPLKLAVQALGAAPGDGTLLLAFKAVEGQARDKYRRSAAVTSHADDVSAVVRRAADDEERHYAWVEQSLREHGMGAGTLTHGVASAVEGLHRLLADPIEGIERQIMQAVGALAGTASKAAGVGPSASRSTASAPLTASPAAARAPTPSPSPSPASPSTSSSGDETVERANDALRFAAALHALEETGDVERMVMLFDDTAEVSGPTDRAPHVGREGARRFWRMYRDSFDEIHSEFEKIVEGRDGTVMLEWTSRGVTATGAPVTYKGVSVAEIPDGRVTRFRTYFDTRDLDAGPADLH